MRTRLREMTPADVPQALERLEEQNARDGTSYALPRVFDEKGQRLRQIPLALVAEDMETGRVVQAHVWETTLEHMAFGVDARATVGSMREQEAVWYLLRQRGFTDEHMFVPVERAPDMKHGLETILGMIATEKVLMHFYRRLDPAENNELRQWYEEQGKKDEPSATGTGTEHSPGRESDL